MNPSRCIYHHRGSLSQSNNATHLRPDFVRMLWPFNPIPSLHRAILSHFPFPIEESLSLTMSYLLVSRKTRQSHRQTGNMVGYFSSYKKHPQEVIPRSAYLPYTERDNTYLARSQRKDTPSAHTSTRNIISVHTRKATSTGGTCLHGRHWENPKASACLTVKDARKRSQRCLLIRTAPRFSPREVRQSS